MSESKNENLTLVLPNELAEKIYTVLLTLIEQEKSILNKEDDTKAIRLVDVLIEEQLLPVQKSPSAEILQIKAAIKTILIEDVERALHVFREKLAANSKMQDDVIELLSRYNRVSSTMQKGLVDFSIADMEINKIVNTVIYMVNNMDENELI